MAIVGGTGTIIGPFLGAGVVLGLRNWVSSFVEMHHAIMGAVFIATVLWAPQGLVGLAAQLRARLARRGKDKR
jgi:branched-chain amino acid transport system permease protein